MKYGISLQLWDTAMDDRLLPIIEELRADGFDGVEVPIFDLRPAVWAPWHRRLTAMGLEITAGTACFAETNPLDDDPAVRRRARDRLRTAIDCCAELHAGILAGPFHSALGVFSGAGPTTTEWGRSVEYLHDAAQYAAAREVTLAIEFLNRFECYLLNTSEAAARLVRDVGHERCVIHYDTFHAHIEERNIAAAITAAGALIGYVHVAENDRGIPGQGAVAWKATFDALRTINYDGWLTIEAFGTALPQIAAATRVWRRTFESEGGLAREGLAFMRREVAARWPAGESDR
jgi:D-psicose/D-tagatose/L-ribulose 3-epimerase